MRYNGDSVSLIPSLLTVETLAIISSSCPSSKTMHRVSSC